MKHRDRATYLVRRFELRPVVKFGLLFGAAVGFLPSLLIAWAVLSVVSGLRQLMENASHVGRVIPVINQRINFDFVDLLGLSGYLQNLAWADDRAWLVGIGVFVCSVSLAAATFGLAAVIMAIVYNWLYRRIGGLKVEL